MAPSEATYLDDTGRPILRQSIVAFIDILGFSQMVTSSTRQEESQRLLDTIYAAVQDSRKLARGSVEHEPGARSVAWVTKFFSDNLALGFPLGDGDRDHANAAALVVRAAQQYQLSMALSGFFLRGALTVGDLCLTDEIIFGSSLIECYQLESKASIVPRVILTESLWKPLSRIQKSESHSFETAVGQSICRDVDGWWFVNYLQGACSNSGVNWEFIERHKRSILESLAGTTRHDVLPKFGWACRYHNVFCHWHCDDPGYRDCYRIDRVDEQSTICRLEDWNESGLRSIQDRN